MGRSIRMAVLVFCLALAATARGADGPAAAPIRVSVCDVLRDPAAYNHRRIEVSGDVSRGFEDFTLSSNLLCGKAGSSLWLELGGRIGSEVLYCCGTSDEAVRDKPLIVEGVVTQLRQDAVFKRFQELTRPTEREEGRVRATVVGIYFSGVKQVSPGGTFWGGYGHFGMYSLLVVEQVLAVSPEPMGKQVGR